MWVLLKKCPFSCTVYSVLLAYALMIDKLHLLKWCCWQCLKGAARPPCSEQSRALSVTCADGGAAACCGPHPAEPQEGAFSSTAWAKGVSGGRKWMWWRHSREKNLPGLLVSVLSKLDLPFSFSCWENVLLLLNINKNPWVTSNSLHSCNHCCRK